MILMKAMNVYFENKDFNNLSKNKGKKDSWREYILKLYAIKKEHDAQMK